MGLLDDTIREILPVNRSLELQARSRLDSLTKPKGSLGDLEDVAVRYCLARGTLLPDLGRKIIFTFAGDHGVVAEGVSAYPGEVTRQMVKNMLAGGAAVNVLARHAGAEVCVVDIGVAGFLEDAEGLIVRKIRPGTANMAEGPAMTEEEARQAVEVGINLARDAANQGATLIGTGEMGIGNTSSSSALLAALLPCGIGEVTDRGTGIEGKTLAHKIAVIERSLEVNRVLFTDPLHTLAAVGGLEIAGICGLILGAASKKIPIVVDGFISSAGALVACRLCLHAAEYLFFSHLSAEGGHKIFFEHFHEKPLLNLGMRLGEGTGAALAMFVIEAAMKVYGEMATFASAGVSHKGG
ncbi:MAG: nicotinate-nucleotide--dimethylbenzimidazole phosphoribosyltransferase [Deltaproteobacteria bacterium]|nr:nicotinate-nucleotide--dimethylbenzimidazole phosphoribosyltransferase [Deltaproteobacteria bacterium]